MGAMKVWDGSTWQTVAGQGAPGAPGAPGPGVPPGGVFGQHLIKSSSTDYATQWDGPTGDQWVSYIPSLGTDQGSGGMTPGAGGFIQGYYRFVAPYAMALMLRFQWGSSGGNGGAGNIVFGLPAGYSSGYYQYPSTIVWTGDGFWYRGLAALGVNGTVLSPRVPFAGLTDRWVGSQVPLNTSGIGGGVNPTNWYPNGGCQIDGVIAVNPRY